MTSKLNFPGNVRRAAQWNSSLHVLFTDKSMILATNATDALARDFVAHYALRKLLSLSLSLPGPSRARSFAEESVPHKSSVRSWASTTPRESYRDGAYLQRRDTEKLWVQARRNLMSHAQKPFVFWRNGRVHLNRPGGVSSVDYWQPRCAHQR